MHHFKWTDSVLARLIRREKAYASGDWHLTYPDTVDESRKMLKHFETNNGRIDVTTPELQLHRCGSQYTDYAPWPDLIPTLKAVR